jgi:soluble lytic murein transglycosylase-like protein
MKRMTVAAAAFAAGMVAFVAQSHAEREPAVFGMKRAASPEKSASKKEAKAADASSRKSAKAGDSGSRTKRAAKAAKPKRASLEAKRLKKGRVTPHIEKLEVDAQTTASIAPGVRPALTAVARKAVKGVDAVESDVKAAGSAAYTVIVARYASSNGVPVSLAHAVISVESSYSPNKIGRAGEIGLMQIKPATARMMGYSGSASGLYDPETNIKFGMMYLGKAHELSGGETCGTILRYNAGHAARRMNPVSAAYCTKVKALLGG